jgi:hypothetical protein
MSRVELDAVQARTDAATEGPWAWEMVGEKDNDWAIGHVIDEDDQPISGQLETGQGVVVDAVCENGIDSSPADAAFIAHARTDVPALVAELRVARTFRDDVHSALQPGRWRGYDGPDGVSKDEVIADIVAALERHDQSSEHDQTGSG